MLCGCHTHTHTHTHTPHITHTHHTHIHANTLTNTPHIYKNTYTHIHTQIHTQIHYNTYTHTPHATHYTHTHSTRAHYIPHMYPIHTHTHTPLQGSPLTGKAGWINLGDTRHPSGQIPSLQRAGSLGVHLSWLTKTPVWPTEWPEVANGNTGQPVRHEFLINRN